MVRPASFGRETISCAPTRSRVGAVHFRPIDGGVPSGRERDGRRDNRVHGDPEVAIEVGSGRARAEPGHADEQAPLPDPAVPAEARAGLDGDPRRASRAPWPGIQPVAPRTDPSSASRRRRPSFRRLAGPRRLAWRARLPNRSQAASRRAPNRPRSARRRRGRWR